MVDLKLPGIRAPDPMKSRCLERADDSSDYDPESDPGCTGVSRKRCFCAWNECDATTCSGSSPLDESGCWSFKQKRYKAESAKPATTSCNDI